MDSPAFADSERVKLVEDGHPDLFGTVVRRFGRTLYVVKYDGGPSQTTVPRRCGQFVGAEFMRKLPPLQQLAEQALGNKTDNLSGKE